MEITYTIEGIEELVKKLESKALLGQALRDIFNKATLTLQRNVQTRTKIDTGRLRGSITTEVDNAPLPKWGKVGTNTTYAPYVEWDTRPHWPPIAAITPWAHRHGISPFVVALAISKHGTKGVHMFEQGLEASKPDIDRIVDEAATTIEEKFSE